MLRKEAKVYHKSYQQAMPWQVAIYHLKGICILRQVISVIDMAKLFEPPSQLVPQVIW